MKVHEIMSLEVVVVQPSTKFRDLWKQIIKKKIHALPVVDKKKHIVGIISEEDLIKPLYPQYSAVVEDFVSASDFEEMEEKIHDLVKLTASDVMNSRVIFTRSDTPIMRALSRMMVRDVRQLPVVSEGNTLLGVVSKGDIFDTLFKKHLRLPGFTRHPRASVRNHLKKNQKKRN